MSCAAAFVRPLGPLPLPSWALCMLYRGHMCLSTTYRATAALLLRLTACIRGRWPRSPSALPIRLSCSGFRRSLSLGFVCLFVSSAVPAVSRALVQQVHQVGRTASAVRTGPARLHSGAVIHPSIQLPWLPSPGTQCDGAVSPRAACSIQRSVAVPAYCMQPAARNPDRMQHATCRVATYEMRPLLHATWHHVACNT